AITITSPSASTWLMPPASVRHGVATFEQSLASFPVTDTKTRTAASAGGMSINSDTTDTPATISFRDMRVSFLEGSPFGRRCGTMRPGGYDGKRGLLLQRDRRDGTGRVRAVATDHVVAEALQRRSIVAQAEIV